MSFVHKFKQLIHNSFQELPMRAQKPWVLSNNVPGNPTKKKKSHYCKIGSQKYQGVAKTCHGSGKLKKVIILLPETLNGSKFQFKTA